MNYETAIIQALRTKAPQGLMDLRRAVTPLIGLEASIHEVRAQVRALRDRGRVIVETHKNGFSIYLPEQKHDSV